ncbi:MAG: 3-oxoacyl-ACP reductase FabG [Xanthomonadales bacterium]|nr:3-oxoacyl-ACP reductase FabG [Xanthomonadales bacterium]
MPQNPSPPGQPSAPPPRRALVTGGSGDLGAAICHALARAGIQVIVHGHSRPEQVAAVAAAINKAGGHVETVLFDVVDSQASQQAIEQLLAHGGIDIVVNNAGIHDDAPMAGMSDAQWRRVIDVSVHGFFHVTRPLLLPMARARFGRVISVSSVAAVTGNRGQTNYAAAKAALHGATLSLAREMASRGITANVVAPGIIAGSMTQGLFSTEQLRHLVPAGRAGKPEDVAQMVAFLASDAAGYVNGQIIGVNGGMA